MALTRDMILASRQAQRLSADAEFMAVLARIERTATEQAVQNPVPEQREACRQLALTVMCIRQEIAADADLEAAEASREHLARGME